MTEKRSYIFLAEGFEEIEALATADVLRRAGVDLTTVSVTDDLAVTGAHGITVEADTTIDLCDLDSAQWLILPGGMPGASNLAACPTLCDALRAQDERGGGIAAICAAPAVVLATLGLLKGRKATCYPGFEAALASGGAEYTGERVTVDGNVITGTGPSSALPFALAIATAACGKDVADGVAAGMLC